MFADHEQNQSIEATSVDTGVPSGVRRIRRRPTDLVCRHNGCVFANLVPEQAVNVLLRFVDAAVVEECHHATNIPSLFMLVQATSRFSTQVMEMKAIAGAAVQARPLT